MGEGHVIRSSKFGVNRRNFIKASAASGVALAGGSVFAPVVRAATSIKFGYVSPQTGPLAAFAEADKFVISNFLKILPRLPVLACKNAPGVRQPMKVIRTSSIA
jgi:hypothetical protein